MEWVNTSSSTPVLASNTRRGPRDDVDPHRIDVITSQVSSYFHRAAPGGAGGTKCIGNYAQVLVTQLDAKAQGYSDVLYLDAKVRIPSHGPPHHVSLLEWTFPNILVRL